MRPANSVVAIVDDEENIRETVSFALRREGYPVELYPHGLEAWRAFQDKLPGLVILDILMPEMDGLELCRRIRSLSESVPIIFLTSRDEELDRVLGLEIGADDYLCKPFSLAELLARVRALLRRGRAEFGSRVAVGDLVLDSARYTAWRGPTPIELTARECAILELLMHERGRVVPRLDIVERAWPHGVDHRSNVLEVLIKRLREKIDRPFGLDSIQTVRGVGYRLVA
jgi:DNA-binding response OmpR family regulator